MLYPRCNDKNLSMELFKNPTAEYRGTPFWAWNCELKKDLLLREIDYMKAMGLGGFHIHSRSGMATPYLTPDFMELVKACNRHAKENNMLCWLYDEDRWPSGAAGGYVTRDEQYRSRYLLFTSRRYGETNSAAENEPLECAQGSRTEKGTLLGIYYIELKAGVLSHYQRIKIEEIETYKEKPGDLWYAYLEISPDQPWFNNQAYVN